MAYCVCESISYSLSLSVCVGGGGGNGCVCVHFTQYMQVLNCFSVVLTTFDGHYVCWSTWGDCCILSITVKDGILPSTTVQPCDVPGTITRTKA